MTSAVPAEHRELAAEALAELGVRRMLFAIHGASFPADPDEDLGVGAPGTRAARRLLELVRALGFTGVQLGPAGETSPDNPSPYDATIFARGLTSIAVGAYAPGGDFAGLIDAPTLEAIRGTGSGGDRGDHRRAHAAAHELAGRAWAAFAGGRRPDLVPRLAAFVAAHRWWLERDGLFAPLAAPAREAALAAHGFGQMIAHAEHDRVRALAAELGLALYADLQVGVSVRDAWGWAPAFLADYVLGAPPSRTNPEGQPWNYPVLDPAGAGPGGAALALVTARADKAFAEHDSLRIDHPHGLVCPWVYRRDAVDPAVAVREGARLRESPALDDHPGLARYAIVSAEQLDRSLPRHADGWVQSLSPAQIDRFAVFFDAIVTAADRHGRARADLSCEVLSTLPHPLRCVLERYGLGRWRVLQKANLDDPADVYRPEQAAPQDWVMLGNHDTAPIFAVIASWDATRRERWATHLTRRLALGPGAAAELIADRGLIAAAMLAELFTSRAENVMVFFADLFGYEERFNVPGTVAETNWSLRLPSSFAALYRDRLARGEALNVPLALALALHARGSQNTTLFTRLAQAAAAAGRPLPAAVASG